MSDQHEREQLDRIEQWLRFTDPGLVHAFESGQPREDQRLATAARIGAYVVAAVLLILGTATVSLLLFLTGTVVLSLAGALHVAGWMRRRRHGGWAA